MRLLSGPTWQCDRSCTGTSVLPSYLTENTVIGDLWHTYLVGSDLYRFYNTTFQRTRQDCICSRANTEEFKRQCCIGSICSGSAFQDCIEQKREEVEQECQVSLTYHPCEACLDNPVLKRECPPSMKQCFDGHCVGLTDPCPSVVTCPRDQQIRCMNGQCVFSRSQCESSTSCPAGQITCEDGSCASSYEECSFIICPTDRPALCWDQSCRLTAADCPEMEFCPSGQFFCGITGKCVYDRSTCMSSRCENCLKRRSSRGCRQQSYSIQLLPRKDTL